MPKRTYPLELVLTPYGTAELRNADEEIIWASDSDDDFKEEIPSDFLEEDDFADILEYLDDNDIISPKEFKFFELDQWECNVEVLDPDNSEDDENDEEEEETEDDT